METGEGSDLNVAVLGPGGVGGLLGALLTRLGDQVVFIAGPETAATLNRQGLSIRSSRYGNFTAAATAVTTLSSPVDICVVAVKATQLDAALERLPADQLGDGLVVPFLNGIEHLGVLRARYGDKVIPATMRVEASRVAPGVVEHASPFMKVELAADADASLSRQQEVHTFGRHLALADIEVTVVEDELSMLWGKLIFLAPLALLTTRYQVPAGTVRDAHRDEMLAVIHEIAIVADKSGANVSADGAVQLLDSIPPTMQSSMQRDAEDGRPIEIEAIGGAILRSAAEVGLAAPATEKLVEELRRLNRG
jgi:2-dehydropantoate 2-reductase